MLKNSSQLELQEIYRRLFTAWGRQHWWPAQSRFEMIVGAYLTQNTSWTNVERALARLRGARALHLNGIRRMPMEKLEELLRPAGYYRQKAQRLKQFVLFLDKQYQGSLDCMFSRPTDELREELLALNGVGPETADSILLYAGNHPVFVIDAYTRRILSRHGIAKADAPYEELRALCEQAMGAESLVAECESLLTPAASPGVPAPGAGANHTPSRMSRARRSTRVQIFNEMHGLLVGVAKSYCRKTEARCEECPLADLLKTGRCTRV